MTGAAVYFGGMVGAVALLLWDRPGWAAIVGVGTVFAQIGLELMR